MDVVALQETRWPLAGTISTKKYIIYYSGRKDNRYYGGVGFAVNKRIAESVIHFEAKDDRMCSIRLRGKFKNISLVSFYAPTEDAEDEEKDSFYELLEEQVDKLPSYDMKIVLGDANAKVGREDIFQPAIGKESLHQDSNDNGTRLASFALANSFKISSTMFPRKDIHKYTWTSPNGATRNQIDHVLVDQRHKSSITDIRSVRGAECGTDHVLVLVKIAQRIAIQKRKEEKCNANIDTGKLKDIRVAKEFEMKVENRFQALQELPMEEEEDVDKKWNDFKENILETAREVCGKNKKKQQKTLV
ncbi:craniofacial development protein 2-like [Ischnura elegans]|uniref:craniofacial development protein 2-like n=1 Tax=Ischnura elegans TaxID=197161 RepID=UPI001ED8AD12|nr:craniofacial development protein 2-like [Ischnura elegans]